jgi:hypothetical protein
MIIRHGRRLPAKHAMLALAAVASAAAVGPAEEARAAEYTIANCQQHPSFNVTLPTNTASGPWQAVGGAEAAGGYELDCGPNNPIQQFGIRMHWSTIAGFEFDTGTKPITIKRVRAHYKGYVQAAGSQVFANILAGRGTPGGYSWSEVSGGAATHEATDDVSLSTPAKAIRIRAFCSTSASDKCHYRHNFDPILELYGAAVTLTETTDPEAEATGGSLLAAGAQQGTRSVGFRVTDGESGVRSMKVLLGATVVASADFGGACSYTDLAACPLVRTGSVNVNTGVVPDGRYDLRLEATDAAGNTTMRTVANDVQVDNVPDEGPSSVVVPQPLPGPAGREGSPGTPGTDGRDGAPAPRTANGRNASAEARLTAIFASKQRTMRARYGTRVLITGQLAAPSGTPIVGARLDVLTQARLLGATMAPAGQVTTDAQGRFRYIAPVGASRTIRFAYKAHLEDTAFAAQQDVELGVIASVSLKVSKTSLRNGQTVRFTGQVPGAPKGSRKVVELQVRKGARWMTFRSTRLSGGRFSSSYRFTRTRGVKRYEFRARVRTEEGFPFLTGHSRSARVTVRG